MTVGRGMRNDWTSRTSERQTSQATSTTTNTTTAGSQSRAARPRTARSRQALGPDPGSARAGRPPRRRLVLAERLADLR